MLECPICFEERALVTLAECKHGFCAVCLRKQLRFDHRCALCRRCMTGCVPSLVYPHPTLINRFVSMWNVDVEAGIEVGWVGDTAIVRRVVHNAVAARRGVRVDDVLLSVNGLPCVSRELFDVIVSSTDRVSIRFHVCRPPRPHRRCCTWASRIRDCLTTAPARTPG